MKEITLFLLIATIFLNCTPQRGPSVCDPVENMSRAYVVQSKELHQTFTPTCSGIVNRLTVDVANGTDDPTVFILYADSFPNPSKRVFYAEKPLESEGEHEFIFPHTLLVEGNVYCIRLQQKFLSTAFFVNEDYQSGKMFFHNVPTHSDLVFKVDLKLQDQEGPPVIFLEGDD